MTATTGGIKAVESLSAHEFSVEIDGAVVPGIFSVSGLTSFMLDGDFPPLVISKMVQHDPDLPVNVWTRETCAGSKPTRDVAIIAMDEGVENRRWVYHGAYITEISFSEFNTAESELVAERMVIKAASVEEIWP